MRLYPPTFTGIEIEVDPQGLIDELEKIFKVMHANEV